MSAPSNSQSRLSPPPLQKHQVISSSPDDFLTLNEILGTEPKRRGDSSVLDSTKQKVTRSEAVSTCAAGELPLPPPLVDINTNGNDSIIEVSADTFKPKPSRPPRKPLTKKAVAHGETEDTQTKAPRNPQATKTSQTEPIAPNGDSAPTKPKRKAPVKRKKVDTKSSYFESDRPETIHKTPTTTSKASKPATPKEVPLNLEAALPRRQDWTPPPPDTNPINESLHSGGETAVESLSATRIKRAKEVFNTLSATFGCQDSIENVPPMKATNPEGSAKKRKLVDTVIPKAPVPAVSVRDTFKAPRKKISTLTDLAVAQYDNHSVIDLTFMAGYHDPGLAQAEVVDEDQPIKPKRKRKQKPQDPGLILLSPGTAMRQTDEQEFVFGTSSQLVREDSPSVLRDIQLAIEQSNMMEEDPIGWFDDEIEIQSERWPKLWNAACRNDDGTTIDLRDPDISNLQEDIIISNDVKIDSEKAPPVASSYESFKTEEVSEYPHIDLVLEKTSRQSSDLATAQSRPSSLLPLPTHSSPIRSHSGSPSVSSLSPTGNVAESIHHEDSFEPNIPRLDLLTDLELSRRVTEFGFKTIRKRADMIGLLESCYSKTQTSNFGPAAPPFTAKHSFSTSSPAATASFTSLSSAQNHKTVTGTAPTKKAHSRRTSINSRLSMSPPTSAQPPEPDTSSPPPPTSKRGRGRPRKSPATATAPTPIPQLEPSSPKTTSRRPSSHAVIEIPDSEESDIAALLSVNETHESCDGSTISDNGYLETALGGETSHIGDLSLAIDPDTEKKVMFDSISSAVQTAPRTTDVSNPSWYDRILLYDPIAYEDLTVWLNTGQLERIGYDDEVSPEDVKEWCESKSICCVQRETRKGKERKRL
ncbi:hypothetical protein BROUX41_003029 [Berkeleyomyces rouxiae]|uniref:uncharacterized protein n=1 Tax=Berkeleyomyces rouxiae TaxID=2035830 RepID=UPI003B7E0D09